MRYKSVEYIVIGAGIIGLAIARTLALSGKEVLVLERNNEVGAEGSFRNSAVLHAGIYYPEGSLKAKFCREGQELLYDYCQKHQVPVKRIGKLIVATAHSQNEKIRELEKLGKANGVKSLAILTAQEIHSLEPQVAALQGLYSPDTGIVHGQTLLQSFKKDIEKAGGIIQCSAPVQTGMIWQDNMVLYLDDAEQNSVSCRYLINAAGLWADKVAHTIQGIPKECIPEQYFAKGNYFSLAGPSPFSHLVYPLPEEAGLGIHATVDLDNRVRFGPDVEWVGHPNYTVSLARAPIFYQEIRRYYPELADGSLTPALVGIRPKLRRSGFQDFLIQSEQDHGIKNLVNLFGMESPGLTASMAIGHYVNEILSRTR